MELTEQRRINDVLEAIGMHARGTSVGLLQLSAELLRAGVLGEDAVGRIKEAMVRDISLACPRSMSRQEYENRIRESLDGLLPSPSARAAEHASERDRVGTAH